MVDLKTFCMAQEDVSIINMMEPWSDKRYTYASDGKLLIRVPMRSEVQVNGCLNKEIEKFNIIMERPVSCDPQSIPDLPGSKPCPKCNGSGVVYVAVCPECDGDGHVYFSNDFSHYEFGCESCCGSGRVKAKLGESMVCEECEGEKIDFDFELTRIEIGCTGFALRLLRKISTLPGVQIFPERKDQANYIKFDGGDGLIMPMLE